MTARPRIAAVDDDPFWLAVLGRALVREGIHADLIGDPLQAIDRIAELRPSVVVTDYSMPRQSGAELAVALRARLGIACPPLVLVTGDASELTRGEVALFDAVFEKPVRLPALLRAITRLASRRVSGTQLRAQIELPQQDDDAETG